MNTEVSRCEQLAKGCYVAVVYCRVDCSVSAGIGDVDRLLSKRCLSTYRHQRQRTAL